MKDTGAAFNDIGVMSPMVHFKKVHLKKFEKVDSLCLKFLNI